MKLWLYKLQLVTRAFPVAMHSVRTGVQRLVGSALVALACAVFWFAPVAAQAQSASNGKVLYNTIFVAGKSSCGNGACHGPNPATRQNKIQNGANSPSIIAAAINGGVADMTFLKGLLTTSNLADLAAYIANPTVTTGSPTASLSVAQLSFASTTVGSTAAAQTVTLTNSGTAALTITSTTISGDFAISSNTCTAGASIAVSASCSVSVTFTPTASGARSGTLSIVHNATPTTSTVSLSGTGAAVATNPVASIAPASLSFASTNVGSTAAAQTVTLSNTGTAPLVLGASSIVGSDFAIGSSTCISGTSVAAGSSCTMSISFTPTVAGSRNATLSIAHNASPTTSSVSLSGTGVAVVIGSPVASVSPAQLTFASTTVGATATAQTITLSNTGTAALVLGGTTVTGTDFAIASSSCGTGVSLAAGASCSISVTFTPAAAGARSGSVTISHNASPASTSVALSGTGAAVAQGAPVASLSSSGLTFASTNVGSTAASQTVTITNSGTASLTISAFALTGSDFSAPVNSCTAGASLAPQASCTISVWFTPSVAGSRTGQISLTHNATPSTSTIALSGTGAQVATGTPVASVNIASVAFGSVSVGAQSPSQAVSITNTGNAALTIASVTVTPSTMRIVASTCTSTPTLAVGASCTVMVAFAPASVGDVSGTLSFTHNASPATSTVALSGTGVAATTALPPTRTMVEYLYTPLNYYFITSRANEQAILDGIAGFQRTGASFLVYASQQGDMRAINRIYFDRIAKAGSRGSHFYTLLDADLAVLMNLNPQHATTAALPQNEGVDSFAYLPLVSGVGGSCASGQLPVYRLFRGAVKFPDDPNHRYTTSLTVYNQFVANGWDGEGVNFCVPAQ